MRPRAVHFPCTRTVHPRAPPVHYRTVHPPCTSKRCRYDEGLSVGWRAYHSLPLCWADGVADGVPCVAFPFGHGAGYTSFEYTWAQPPARAAPLPGGPLAAAGGGADNALVANMSVVVRNGGHELPAFQPRVAYDMFRRFVAKAPFDKAGESDAVPNTPQCSGVPPFAGPNGAGVKGCPP